MPPSANTAGGRRVTRWTRELDHREDPRVERPLRRAAVLGRLEPVAGPLARAGMARRALPRGRLALDQRRQAPVRRARSTPPCARPAWSRTAPGRAAARPAPRAPASSSARRVGAPQRRRRAAGGGLRALARRAPRGRAGAPPGRGRAPCRARRGPAGRRAPARAGAATANAGRARRARERVAVAERGLRVATDERSRRWWPTPTPARARPTTRREAAVRDAADARPRAARGGGPRRGGRGTCRGGAERMQAASGAGAAWQAARAAEACAAAAERRAARAGARWCAASSAG